MPTIEHNGLVEMFRDNPGLAPHLLDILFHLDLPPYASVAVVESALDQLAPAEFRADLVLDLRDEAGAAALSIVLEVQRDRDPDKKRSWPVYVATVHARRRCAVVVLVVTTDPSVAAWAAEPIDLGLGLSTVKPLVLGPSVVPEVTDPVEAEREKELSILSAVAHGNGPNGLAVVLAALAALGRLDLEHAAVYFHIVYSALREPMQRAIQAKIMEQRFEIRELLPPFMQQLIDEGVSRGERQAELRGEQRGERRGEQRGEQQGELQGKRAALLRVIARIGVALGDEDRERIQACADSATLDRWLDNAVGARTAADVFA